MGMMKEDRMPIERHGDARPVPFFDLRAELPQRACHVLEVEIGRNGMSENGVHDFAMAVVHGRAPCADFALMANTKAFRRVLRYVNTDPPTKHKGPLVSERPRETGAKFRGHRPAGVADH